MLANVQPGDRVGVFGAGPVGLVTAYSARLRGSSEVFVVDAVDERPRKAREIGAIPVGSRKWDPVEQILEHRHANQTRMQALRPGEDKILGVM